MPSDCDPTVPIKVIAIGAVPVRLKVILAAQHIMAAVAAEVAVQVFGKVPFHPAKLAILLLVPVVRGPFRQQSTMAPPAAIHISTQYRPFIRVFLGMAVSDWAG